jgi:hypothetical protein
VQCSIAGVGAPEASSAWEVLVQPVRVSYCMSFSQKLRGSDARDKNKYLSRCETRMDTEKMILLSILEYFSSTSTKGD